MGWYLYLGGKIMNYRKVYLLIIVAMLVIFLVIIHLFAAENVTIRREEAMLREGPGSYYPPIAILPEDLSVTVVEDGELWLKVQADEQIGYISRKVIEGKKDADDMFAQMGSERAITEISDIGMTAGIKAMSGRFSSKIGQKKNFIDVFLGYHIDPYEFNKFKEITYRLVNLKKIQKKIKLPIYDVPQFFTFSEEAMGIAIANRIAEIGLYSNKALQDYVNYIGLLVANASDSYDIPYKFFILDFDIPNAYSCPGGIIFVTTGMLKTITNEAELACVLGHEIAHVSHYHGMEELEKRRVQIIAEDSFAELDALSDSLYGHDSKYDDAEAELEDIALSVYEVIYAGRLEKYEEEADKLALIYASRAGYDPYAFEDLLGRLIMIGQSSNNEHYTLEQIGWRRNLISQRLESTKYPDGLRDWAERYQLYTNTLKSSKY